MKSISTHMEDEIRRRVEAGPYRDADELLRNAFAALDHARLTGGDELERELLEGLRGQEVEMTDEDWSDIESEGVRKFEARKRQ